MTQRIHGGFSEQELSNKGIDQSKIIDFSVSINPYGPCAPVMEAIKTSSIDRYPDPTSWSLRNAIAKEQNVNPDEVVVGNGSCDLLWTIAHTFGSPEMRVAFVEPTFSEFRIACETLRAQIVEWRAASSNGFAVDINAVDELFKKSSPRILYFCSPNTPTGRHLPTNMIAELAGMHSDILFVLDQVFLSLSEYFFEEKIPVPPNVIRVRSLTKEHSIPGVRIGYLLCEAQIAAKIESSRAQWTTSSLAQAAALAALKESLFVDTSRTRLLSDREALFKALQGWGLSPVASSTVFFLLPVKNSAVLRERLLSHGILVRDCASFGLPNYIRVSARPEADREILLGALRKEITLC